MYSNEQTEEYFHLYWRADNNSGSLKGKFIQNLH